MKKLSEINERLWTTAINRGIEGRVKKEDDKTPIIKEFMERHKISNYTINKDMTVDVNDAGQYLLDENIIKLAIAKTYKHIDVFKNNKHINIIFLTFFNVLLLFTCFISCII